MGGARAEDLQPGATLSLESAAELATRFYDQGRLKDAAQIVAKLRPLRGVPAQIVFLSAHLLESQGDLAGACAEYRLMLDQHPELPRVRLDLARALFLSGQFDQARYHFERALAGDLPDPVRASAQSFLEDIRNRTYSLQLGASLVSDTNINQGPALDAIYLPGSYYTLGSDARERPALGLWVSAGARVMVSRAAGVYARASAEEQTYGGGAFDFLAAQAALGRRWVLGSGASALSLEGAWLAASLGDHALYQGPQLQVASEHRLSRGVGVGMSLVARWLDYPNSDYLSGLTTWALPSMNWRPDPASAVSLTLGLGQTGARSAAFRSGAALVATSLQHDFSGGISTYASASLQRTEYAQPDALFGDTRRDSLLQAEIGVHKRNWTLLGLSPRLSLRFTRNASSLDLYGFERRQLLLGATRDF